MPKQAPLQIFSFIFARPCGKMKNNRIFRRARRNLTVRCRKTGCSMETQKILDLENDGLNMASEGRFLYLRCKREMYKYDLANMSCSAHSTVFKKDGRARSFSICEESVFLTDFCDLYILDKNDLKTQEVMRLGSDLSSDLGAVRFDAKSAYVSIRNGGMAVVDLRTRAVKSVTIGDASSWDFCVAGAFIYTGTINGEIIVTSTDDLQFVRKSKVCGKNIYSVVCHNGTIYTVSQDTTIKALNAATLEVVRERKKAVKGMVRILGILDNNIVVADGGISLWDVNTLELTDRFDFPTGHFNKGAVLHGNTVIGSDYKSLYSREL